MPANKEPLQPYEAIRKVTDGVHTVDGDWYNTPFRRRMTILSLRNGDLVIHSAVRMKDEDLARLDQLGRVAYVLVPNNIHDSDAPSYAERYPQAKILVPGAHADSMRKQMRVDGTLEKDWPESLRSEIACVPIRGTRMHEAAFVHLASGTLVLTDLVFNYLASDFSGLTYWITKMNRMHDRFGPSRLAMSYFFIDKKAIRESVDEVLKLKFERVLMSHGRIVESGGHRKMDEAFTGPKFI